MKIKDTFLKLTSETYPYGYEEQLLHFLPKGYKMDIDGNYYYEVGESKNIFACHLDTACKTHNKVKHVLDGKFIRTDRTTILGADDKAGMTIILYMIEKNVPGLYYFFVGEEVGCIGSTAASKRIDFFSNYNKIISFDRRGTESIITHQTSLRSCSDEFADSLSKEFAKHNLNLEKDDTGVYTDSAEFTGIIPECTNISVGYYKEHTHDECQDIEFLEKLTKSCALVNWDSLEVKRDPSKKEWKSYNGWSSRTDVGYVPYFGEEEEEEWARKSTRRSRGRKGYNNDKNVFVDYTSKKNEDKNIDADYYSNKYKKKIYYNDLDTELEQANIFIDDRHKTDYYRGVRKLFLDDTISGHELLIIKEQCLDMNDTTDSDFAKNLELFVSI